MSIELSVIVCTYNRSALVAQVIESLAALRADRARFEVLVVDNNSSDDTRMVTERYAAQLPNVRYVLEQRQGLSHARNAGLQAAYGSYVAYIDDDCKLPEGWLERLTAVIGAHAPAVCGGPALAFYDGLRPTWFRDAYGSYDLGGTARPLLRQYLYGMNMTFERATLQALGGFNPAYGMAGSAIGYGEEIEVQRKLRAWRADATIYYDPELYVYHLVRPEKMTVRWILRQRFANGEFAYRVLVGEDTATAGYGQLARRALLAAGGLLCDLSVGLSLRDRQQYPCTQNYLYEQALRHVERLGSLFEQFRQVSRRRVRPAAQGRRMSREERAMDWLDRARRHLARRLLQEPTARLDAAAIGAQIAWSGVNLPGAPRRIRREAIGVLRTLKGQQRPAAQATHPEEVRRTNKLPIIFIHRGNSDYLRYSLGQARRSNPDTPIYLLGNESNDRYAEVTHLPYRQFYERAAELDQTFSHFSTNGLDYERFNFQRWLILDEFLQAYGYGQCLYLDSDVLLFTDVTLDRLRFVDYELAIAHDTGSVCFVNRRETLHELGDFILKIYRRDDRYHYERMVAHYVTRRNSRLPGGACDMMALAYFREADYGRVGDVAALGDGSVYDQAVGAPQGFVMRDGVKQLDWEAGVPYGTLASSGRRIRFNALHFQGLVGKALIAQAYKQADAAYGPLAAEHVAPNQSSTP